MLAPQPPPARTVVVYAGSGSKIRTDGRSAGSSPASASRAHPRQRGSARRNSGSWPAESMSSGLLLADRPTGPATWARKVADLRSGQAAHRGDPAVYRIWGEGQAASTGPTGEDLFDFAVHGKHEAGPFSDRVLVCQISLVS